ncbi:uncharacterized protein UTRI_03497 [Ustilago trichophora]|uniref:Splicing arginine serine-rich 12 n=1 Tax=Ustilago trichophora TaxID=86804 RepID=A0A5C3E486_9BASI|nr:uncharacterized protein UTRI_03497 [Ustilago trichophora]
MAAGDDATLHRSRREDDRDTHHHSRRSHRDQHPDERPDSTPQRSSRRDNYDSSKRRRSRSPSPVRRAARDSLPDGEHDIHPTLLKFGVAKLTEEDYFIRATEFKAWLSESKGKYLDEISSKDARRLFERFVRRWNEAKLPDEYYAGKVRSSSAAAGSSSQTRHRWAFTSKASYSSKEQEQLAMIRDNVDTLTNGDSRGAKEARDAERRARKGRSANAEVDGDADEAPSRDAGWSSSNPRSQPPNPFYNKNSNSSNSSSSRSYADTQLEREHRQDLERVAHSESRRRERQDRADQDEAFHGRATGRDRMLEKKRERAANHREFANRRNADDGIEMDDRELYDQEPVPRATTSSSRGGDARSGGMSKREQARQERIEERQAEMQEKVSALKEKDRKTMEMFKAMAQERFGGGA